MVKFDDVVKNIDKYLLLFPCLIPELTETGDKGAEIVLSGFIFAVCGQEFAVSIKWRTWEDFKNLDLTADDGLAQLVKGHCDEMLSVLDDATSFEQFLYDFKAFVDRHCSKCKRATLRQANISSGIKAVLDSLSKIDSNLVEFVGSNFHEVKLSAFDSQERRQVLHVTLSDSGIEGVKPELPLKVDAFADINVLKRLPLDTVYSTFCNQLSQFEPFWDEMDAIDAACWVVEPAVVDRSASYRRIVLTPFSSLQIKVDPLNPKSFPGCNVIGPDEERKRFFDSINQRVFMWDVNDRLLDNLERILDVCQLPSPKSFEQKVANECQICYSQHLTVEVADLMTDGGKHEETALIFPDIVCPNERCCRLFHKDCLLEWFRSLPNTRQSFKTWTGECPLCSAPMTLQIGSGGSGGGDMAVW